MDRLIWAMCLFAMSCNQNDEPIKIGVAVSNSINSATVKKTVSETNGKVLFSFENIDKTDTVWVDWIGGDSAVVIENYTQYGKTKVSEKKWKVEDGLIF